MKYKEEYEKLASAIRKHRDMRGDDRCFLDDEELYSVLPEGYTPPKRDCLVELNLCAKYIASRHNPKTEYVSPQRRIEELEAELAEMKLSISILLLMQNERPDSVQWSPDSPPPINTKVKLYKFSLPDVEDCLYLFSESTDEKLLRIAFESQDHGGMNYEEYVRLYEEGKIEIITSLEQVAEDDWVIPWTTYECSRKMFMMSIGEFFDNGAS